MDWGPAKWWVHVDDYHNALGTPDKKLAKEIRRLTLAGRIGIIARVGSETLRPDTMDQVILSITEGSMRPMQEDEVLVVR